MWYIYNVKYEIHHKYEEDKMKSKYGLIGFLSLLGFVGLFGGEPLFLAFFAFAIFFEYFWVQPDEMFVEMMRKCATYAFFTNLLITTGATLLLSHFQLGGNPLAGGTALGFGISVAVFAFATFILEVKERIGAGNG